MGMDPMTMIALGSIVNAGAGMFGASSQSNANNANLSAQQQQQAMMRQMVGGQMQNGQNPYSSAILGMLGQMRPPGSPPQAGGYNQQMFGQQQMPMNFGQNIPQGAAPQQSGMLPFTGMMSNNRRPDPLSPGSEYDTPLQGGMDSPGVGNPTGQNGGGPIASGGMSSNYPFPTGQTGQAIPQSQMWQYQNIDPFTYQPTMLGTAPQAQAQQLGMPTGLQAAQAAGMNIASPNQISLESLLNAPQLGPVPQAGAAQVGAPQDVNASQISSPQSVNAQQVAAPAQFNLSSVGAGTVTGTQGNNAGQDALLQMMRRDVGGGQPNQFLTDQLQQLGRGDSQFDNSQLFASFAPLDQQQLDEQVSQLKGSKGSFTKLFSSNTENQEAKMRQQFAQNVQARNMGINQQSFEAAQGRRQPALGQLAGLEQFYGQQPFQNAGLQLQAAQAAGQLGQAGQGLDLQAQLANQATQLASSQANAGNQLQAGVSQNQLASQVALANAANQLQAGQFNVQSGMGAEQQNAQLMQQAALANQQAGLQTGMQNAGFQQQTGQFNAGNALQAMLAQAQMGLTAGQQNQSLGLQAQQSNQNAALQAALANAQYGTQTNLANMGAQNQNQQFGQSLQAQLGQGNQNAALQAALANMQMQGQYGMGNANIANQAGQFNAQAGQQAAAMNAQQGNTYNQLVMSMLGQAGGFQQNQQGMNNQLLGILGGVGIPQQQASPWPSAIADAGSTAMMMPLLMQMMGQGRGPATGYGTSSYPNGMFGR